MKRRPEEARWNSEEVLAVKGTPLQPNPESEDVRIRTKMVPGLATTEIVGDPVTKQDLKAQVGEQRPFYMTRANVKEAAKAIGFTDGCAGCRAVEHNYVSRPMHNEACRLRMEAEIRKTTVGGTRMENFEG